MIQNRSLLTLRMVSLALDEIDANQGFPNGENDFVSMVMQYGQRHSVTREEVESLIQQPLNCLIESMTKTPTKMHTSGIERLFSQARSVGLNGIGDEKNEGS